jgi:hypothetical protein
METAQFGHQPWMDLESETAASYRSKYGWYRFRKFLLLERGHKCERCGATKSPKGNRLLHLHHKQKQPYSMGMTRKVLMI